jgi:DNA replication protein DnaC
MLQIAISNYKSELKGEGVLDLSLHRIFLGNPGTGKTTIATLYGKIMAEMGYLSKGDVIIKGASELTGANVGSTAAKVNALIDSVKGKVLVIDEAYVLARHGSLYGAEALDTLVERVQGTPGEDFAVILCGYEDEMMTMLREGNPGLSRRFRIEDAFRFADYNDDELVQIMLQRAKKAFLYVTPELAQRSVKNVLSKQRAKPNFGNVGAVNNLLDSAKEKMMKRSNLRKIDGLWELTDEDLYDTKDPHNAINALDKLCNVDTIRAHIELLEKRVYMFNQKNKDRKSLLKNYVFVGPPGTGKVWFYHLTVLKFADSNGKCVLIDNSGARFRSRFQSTEPPEFRSSDRMQSYGPHSELRWAVVSESESEDGRSKRRDFVHR